VAAINRHHSDHPHAEAEDRILEQLLLGQKGGVPAQIGHHQRHLDHALMVWSEQISLIRLQPLESAYPNLDVDHHKARAHKEPHRSVYEILVSRDYAEQDRKGSHDGYSTKPERQQQYPSQSRHHPPFRPTERAS